MREQLLHATARHVARRLVAAEQEQQQLEDELVVVEAVAVDLGVHEHADEVVGRVRARRSAIMPCAYSMYSPNDTAAAWSASGPPFSEPSISSDQSQQRGAVLRRDAEHVADDDQRQRRGEVVPEVALASLADRVDQLVADAADARRAVARPAPA